MKKMIAAAVTAAALSMAASAATAGTLTNVSVTLSNPAPSQPTDVDIQFTTETMVNTAPHMLYAWLGTGLVMTNATNQCDSNITATLNGVTMPTCRLRHPDQDRQVAGDDVGDPGCLFVAVVRDQQRRRRR